METREDPTMTSYLVMLQTNSNQPFIFSSPRLREQIGASFEITLLSHWVEKEAKELLDTDDLPASFWVSDSSGKVIVRFTGHGDEPKAQAKDLIKRVTLQALTDAPGLDVTGVFIEAKSSTLEAEDLEKLDRAFSGYSLNRRPAAARFLQFPFLERGSESALPASPALSEDDCRQMRCYARETLNVPLLPDEDTSFSPPTQTDQDAKESLSLPSRIKRAWSRSARRLQLKDVVSRWSPEDQSSWSERIKDLSEDPFQLEGAFQDLPRVDGASGKFTALSTVGVIHIDGNGVGAIMRDLGEAFKGTDCHLDSLEEAAYDREDNPCNIDEGRFQWFVMEVNYRLDGAVKEAVARSWADVECLANDDDIDLVPVVPIIVGGDDVTVYTDGCYAIPFAEAYIRRYEELTKDDDLLSVLAIVAGGKKTDAPERDRFEIDDYIIQNPGPLTASAGVAIVGRNFPFHIAYDLAEELVERGKKLGKKPGTVPCSTINFHVLRDATVLDPEDTLNEYKGRSQRPFLIGHYAPQRTGDATTTSAEETPTTTSQSLSSWARILRAVAAFDGKKPDAPTQTAGDPFPRARANRIVKLLAEGKEDQAATEWDDALQNATGAGRLAKQLQHLPPHPSDSAGTGDSLEQIKWLLDLIDLSENLPDRYLASRIGRDADGGGSPEAADGSTKGGAK